MNTEPTAGLFVGWGLGILAATILVVAVGLLIAAIASRDGCRKDTFLHAMVWCLPVGIVLGAGTLVSMWPLKYDYHHWAPKSGMVSEVNKRLVSDNDHGVQEAYLITVNGHLYSVNEARGGAVKPGDYIKLKCKKAYNWGSSNHGWDCKWEQLKRDGKVIG